ncbi:hypothetical protein Y032_0248g100 [Ancylostoma ceylanicum]|uniref:Uncharacterized protein n=1 Tax=Ancylostoma ceylanicum TaxID=53326 RepID=A0A016SCC1_9BILA|nr:hypothetical protein Y032_0248g100 [Ancylostoma ceylanicum]
MMTWIAGKRGSSTAWADSSFRIDDSSNKRAMDRHNMARMQGWQALGDTSGRGPDELPSHTRLDTQREAKTQRAPPACLRGVYACLHATRIHVQERPRNGA